MRKYFYPAGLIGISIIGFFLRYLYIDWGYPFFFHPDENNITSAIIKLSWTSWNPHFFAYGGLPIYATFLIASLVDFGSKSFATTAYTLRSISALFSFLSIPSLFFIGKKLFSKQVGFTASLLASVGIGFIQFAHFGTFEMWLTFFTLWFFYFCIGLWHHSSKRHVHLVGIFAGILMSTKVSSIVFLPLPLLIMLLQKEKLKQKITNISTFCLIVGILYAVTNPFLFLDTKSFISALQYESSVALGTLPVFYTQSFLHTIPVVFQLQHILPFLLNPFVFLLFIFSFFIFLYSLYKEKGVASIFLFIFFLITFLSQAFLFVKWTRYMVPTLPFSYLLIAVALQKFLKPIRIIVVSSVCIISFVLAVAFIHMVYATDSRIAASNFAKQHIRNTAQTIVEPYDLGAIAFSESLPHATISNIYDIETDTIVDSTLQTLLQSDSVFLSPSQRLLHTRLSNPADFPKGNNLYTRLVHGTLGFHRSYQTPCTFWCTLVYVGYPIQGSVEETATVFDHPFVTIFVKK